DRSGNAPAGTDTGWCPDTRPPANTAPDAASARVLPDSLPSIAQAGGSDHQSPPTDRQSRWRHSHDKYGPPRSGWASLRHVPPHPAPSRRFSTRKFPAERTSGDLYPWWTAAPGSLSAHGWNPEWKSAAASPRAGLPH